MELEFNVWYLIRISIKNLKAPFIFGVINSWATNQMK